MFVIVGCMSKMSAKILAQLQITNNPFGVRQSLMGEIPKTALTHQQILILNHSHSIVPGGLEVMS